MAAKCVPLGDWNLSGKILSPTHARLQAHRDQLSKYGDEDPVVSFLFAGTPARTLTIHRSLLISAGGPLEMLITLPFCESQTNEVRPEDAYEAFNILRKFLYCLPIDITTAPPELPLIAHRWQLDVIFNACFAWAELSRLWDSDILVQQWMTVLSLVQPPERFCHFFTRVFGAEFDRVAPKLENLDWKWGADNVWEIFRTRGMLKGVIHTIVQFASKDYSALLLDVILRQLEDSLSDKETEELLGQLDWECSECSAGLKSKASEQWSARAWRNLALTPTPGQRSGGEDFRMQWSRNCFGSQCRQVPACETSDEFTFRGLSFSMTLHSWCWADPVSVVVKINQSAASVVKKFGSVRVSGRVTAVDDGCSCGLSTPERPEFQEYECQPWAHVDVANLTLDCFAKEGGVEFVILDAAEFERWRQRHRHCGLLICVRLTMHDHVVDKTGASENGIGLGSSNTATTSKWKNSGRPWRMDCPCVQCRRQRRLRMDRGHSSRQLGVLRNHISSDSFDAGPLFSA